ncbi:MAG: hypothetical protein HY646_11140 [Acidobacteria bacterium]|nr:hypothetical protein [Acidobacteriota bacterium]
MNTQRPATAPTGGTLREIISVYGALFASLGTLFCCALPALLVFAGFGMTAVLTFFTAIPGWQESGSYNVWLFSFAGVLLAGGFYFAYRAKGRFKAEACEVPQSSRESACSTAGRWNRRILWVSLSLYSLALLTDLWGIGWMASHGYFKR